MALRKSYSTNGPVGAADWIGGLEAMTDRHLAPRKRGPRPKGASGESGLVY